MKKFFSLIALVGVFAACQPEELKTVFESAPAQLTIKVGKVYNAVDGKDLTAVATKDADVVITGNPAIAKGSQVMHASYGGVTGDVTVEYPSIVADTDPITITAGDIWLPGTKNNYKFEVKEGAKVEDTQEFGLLSAENSGISHNDSMWLENANEYILIDTYTYKEYSGSAVVPGSVKYIDDFFKKEIDELVAAKSGDEITFVEKEGTVKVSAWSLYNVINKVTTTTTTMQVIATPDPAGSAAIPGNNGVIATFDVESIVAIPEKVEIAHPSHASHYVEPVGHEEATGNGVHHGTHGDGSNAGGGFVEAE